MKRCALAFCALFSLLPLTPVFATPQEDETRAFFTRFVEAQNAHDLVQIKAMLWDSPKMLWFARGEANWGPDGVVSKLKDYYKGTWQLKPDMSHFSVVMVNDEVAQLMVPVAFTRGHPGEAPQVDTFLISQTLLKDKDGWHVASILPVADTHFK
ncbi:DUF4440 domain-containing protein [Pseudomonas fluorescens]|uniref:DUF4440 domain-containing protein n=1 Tax=Pseudomonas fluorescens TaxID=294 RepID=A0A1T2XXR2_PSEFL|nr:DUF4440 domain-containing protein [Pseudomonas fluorescens]OPA84566.1 DUF4440 domain-containing protein [Pseudomonas fluorescens]